MQKKGTKLDVKHGLNLMKMMVQKWRKIMAQNRKKKMMKNR